MKTALRAGLHTSGAAETLKGILHKQSGPHVEYASLVQYVVSAYPACSPTKYGQLTLGGSPATSSVTLSSDASGEPIALYPHHVMASASSPLTAAKTITVTGLDFYGAQRTTQFSFPPGTSDLYYTPIEFSRVDSITVQDDGADSGKALRFGDAQSSGIYGVPLFGLPLTIHTGEPGVNMYFRNTAEEEWVYAATAFRLLLYRNPSTGLERGSVRWSGLNGVPNGVRQYMVEYWTVTMEGDRS